MPTLSKVDCWSDPRRCLSPVWTGRFCSAWTGVGFTSLLDPNSDLCGIFMVIDCYVRGGEVGLRIKSCVWRNCEFPRSEESKEAYCEGRPKHWVIGRQVWRLVIFDRREGVIGSRPGVAGFDDWDLFIPFKTYSSLGHEVLVIYGSPAEICRWRMAER